MEPARPLLLLVPPAPTTAHAVDAAPPGLEELFRRYHGYVAAIALKLLGSDQELEDLVQDVFLAALSGLRDRSQPEALKGWLALVTVRAARKRLRRRKLRTFLGLDDDAAHALPATDASPEQAALLARAQRALSELPANHRIAWTLRHVEGESLERVAELCECSLATAKRHIAAAQEHLQRTLQP